MKITIYCQTCGYPKMLDTTANRAFYTCPKCMSTVNSSATCSLLPQREDAVKIIEMYSPEEITESLARLMASGRVSATVALSARKEIIAISLRKV